jgi:hypothetical protein
MKKIKLKYLVMALLVIFIGTGCSSDKTEIRKFSKKLVEVLQNKDVEGYLKLCSTKEDYIQMLKNYNIPKKQKQQEIERFNNNNDELERLRNYRIRDFRDACTSYAWDNAVIDKVICGQIDKKSRLKFYQEVLVSFKDNSIPDLRIDMVAKTAHGWKIFDDGALSFRE